MLIEMNSDLFELIRLRLTASNLSGVIGAFPSSYFKVIQLNRFHSINAFSKPGKVFKEPLYLINHSANGLSLLQ